MIYLMKIAAFENDNDDTMIMLLKIGYTKNINKRLETYKNNSPRCKLLYTIPDCTEEEERKLHKYFQKYKNYRNEWYDYVEEILEFFKTHTTRESIIKVVENISLNKNGRRSLLTVTEKINEAYLKYVPRIIDHFNYDNLNPKKYETLRKIKKKIRQLVINYEDISKHFKTKYPEIDFDKEDIISDEAKEIIEKINNKKYFHERMKLIYNLGMSDDLARIVLNNLGDTDYSKFYWSIDKGKAGTLGYQKGNLEKEYNRLDRGIISNSNINIEDDIYNTFSVGSIYFRSEIKEKLQKIYDKTGISQAAKATDLEKYFEMKSCRKVNKETGDLCYSFKIIKKKEKKN